MLGAETGGEGIHDFGGPGELFDRSPIRIVRTSFEAEREHDIAHTIEDYALNAAMKNKCRKTVTALGSPVLSDGAELPFLLPIALK